MPLQLEPSMKGKGHVDIRGKLMVQIAKKKLQRTRKAILLNLLKSKSRAGSQNDLFKLAVDAMFAQAKNRSSKECEIGEYDQMSARLGIKKFGEEAVVALIKEYMQLDKGAFPGKPVIEPVAYEDLTEDERREALESINLIKKKRSGVIKGRTCADGSRQHRYLKPDESVASPTAGLESILSTAVTDVYEGRDVAIFDIPGAYLHAIIPNEKRVVMVLRGDFCRYYVQSLP